jgi:hypothetical protein
MNIYIHYDLLNYIVIFVFMLYGVTGDVQCVVLSSFMILNLSLELVVACAVLIHNISSIRKLFKKSHQTSPQIP